MKPNFRLETERLFMRPFAPEDLDALIELRTDPEVSRYLGGARLQNPQALEKRLQFYIGCYERYGYGTCAMHLKETGEMIGSSGLQPLEETGETEVGYNLAKAFWRKGLGYECARAWLEFGFARVGLEKILAVAQPENTGSWRIMEKLGMTFRKTQLHYDLECVVYSITREEFFRRATDGGRENH